ncbi:hypothetical protein J3R30DRAFT_3706491 [Lentinula aciculospora]|uniref:Uncharacterized protein n=1 Tax=Lentinula aciculospora TaxID=153920 RepID=A0A9W9DKJ5_9AGAR|nr:hypothetical protein J3R30DRAFT_3706491 [Lentinula aciculospora]
MASLSLPAEDQTLHNRARVNEMCERSDVNVTETMTSTSSAIYRVIVSLAVLIISSVSSLLSYVFQYARSSHFEPTLCQRIRENRLRSQIVRPMIGEWTFLGIGKDPERDVNSLASILLLTLSWIIG